MVGVMPPSKQRIFKSGLWSRTEKKGAPPTTLTTEREAGGTAVEKTLGGKDPNQTFPPSLQIGQKARDSRFPTAGDGGAFGLHFQSLDGRPQGYIFNGLTQSKERAGCGIGLIAGMPQ